MKHGWVIPFRALYMPAIRPDKDFSGIFENRVFPSRKEAETVLKKLEKDNGSRGRFVFYNTIQEAVAINGAIFLRAEHQHIRQESS